MTLADTPPDVPLIELPAVEKDGRLSPPGTVRKKWWENTAIFAILGGLAFDFLPYGTAAIAGEAFDRVKFSVTVDVAVRHVLATLGVVSMAGASYKRTP